MRQSLEQARSQSHAGGLALYLRKFYELLGNRRKSERVPISGNIFITCAGRAVDATYECSVVDMSRGGMAVQSPEPLASEAFVQLHSDEYGPRRLARVRYCISTSDVYRIGLEFIVGAESS